MFNFQLELGLDLTSWLNSCDQGWVFSWLEMISVKNFTKILQKLFAATFIGD